MILITTIGRTGSSVLTLYLSKLGLDCGKTRWIPKLDAGMECSRAGQINHLLIQGKLKKEMRERIKTLPNDVVKDPSIMMKPGIMQHWIDCSPKLKVLYLTRDPEGIIQSIRKRPYMNTPVFRCFVDLIEKQDKRFREVMKGHRFEELHYPDFLHNYTATNRILRRVGVKGNRDIWNKVIDLSKITTISESDIITPDHGAC